MKIVKFAVALTVLAFLTWTVLAQQAQTLSVSTVVVKDSAVSIQLADKRMEREVNTKTKLRDFFVNDGQGAELARVRVTAPKSAEFEARLPGNTIPFQIVITTAEQTSPTTRYQVIYEYINGKVTPRSLGCLQGCGQGVSVAARTAGLQLFQLVHAWGWSDAVAHTPGELVPVLDLVNEYFRINSMNQRLVLPGLSAPFVSSNPPAQPAIRPVQPVRPQQSLPEFSFQFNCGSQHEYCGPGIKLAQDHSTQNGGFTLMRIALEYSPGLWLETEAFEERGNLFTLGDITLFLPAGKKVIKDFRVTVKSGRMVMTGRLATPAAQVALNNLQNLIVFDWGESYKRNPGLQAQLKVKMGELVNALAAQTTLGQTQGSPQGRPPAQNRSQFTFTQNGAVRTVEFVHKGTRLKFVMDNGQFKGTYELFIGKMDDASTYHAQLFYNNGQPLVQWYNVYYRVVVNMTPVGFDRLKRVERALRADLFTPAGQVEAISAIVALWDFYSGQMEDGVGIR